MEDTMGMSQRLTTPSFTSTGLPGAFPIKFCNYSSWTLEVLEVVEECFHPRKQNPMFRLNILQEIGVTSWSEGLS